MAKRSSNSSSTFAARQHAWIERITRDPQVSHLQVRIALLISFHLNKVTGDAWPSQGALADALGIHRRTVQLALDALVALGYLKVQIRRGRGRTNKYAAVFGIENTHEPPPIPAEKGEGGFAFSDPKMRIPAQENANPGALKCGPPFAENPSKGTFSKRTRRESKRTGWPVDLVLDQDLITIAAEKGFGAERANVMFERFRNHHQAKGSEFANWTAAWRNWVFNQVQFDAKDRAAAPVSNSFL